MLIAYLFFKYYKCYGYFRFFMRFFCSIHYVFVCKFSTLFPRKYFANFTIISI